MTNAEIKAIIKNHPYEEILGIIDSFIHSARDREIAKRAILDNEHYEPLAAEYELCSRHVGNIVRDAHKIIIAHICT